jgi:hypothetical protein
VSGGNPALVRALLEDRREAAGAAGAASHGLAVTGHFRETVRRCLHRCDPSMQEVVRQLALLDEQVEPALLSLLADLDRKTTTWAVAALNRLGLLSGTRFRHGQARAAVLERMTGEERTEARVRAARTLHLYGAPMKMVARQLLASGRVGTPCSLPLLHEAVEQSVAEGDVDLAVDLLHYAELHDGDMEQEAVTTAMLMRLEWPNNPQAAARWLPKLMLAAQHGALRGRHISTLISVLLWLGRTDAALHSLKQLQGSSAATDPTSLANLQSSGTWLAVLNPDTLPALGGVPAEQVRREHDAATALNPQVRAAGLMFRLLFHGPSPASVGTAERSLRSGTSTDQSAASLVVALLLLISCDRLDEAARWTD